MNFLKKRSGAIIAAVVIIILSSFFAMNRSLNVRVRAVNDLFSDGVYDTNAGYKQPSIRKQLDSRKDASLNLITVGAQYDGAKVETEALRNAQSVLSNGLTKSAGPEKLYAENKDLQAAFDALYAKLSTLTLDSRNKQTYDEAQKSMVGAAAMIDKSGYNEAVRAFDRDVLSVFPTNYIKQFAMVKGPELFD